jgi:hypothetical protein
MSILDVRQDHIDAFTAAFAGTDVTLLTHDGRFDLGELKRWAVQAPCAILTLVTMSPVTQPESLPFEVTVRLGWALYLVAKNTPSVKRGDTCVGMLDTVLNSIRINEVWKNKARVIKNLRAESLYSGVLDQTGVAIWAMLWDQAFDLFDP